MTFQASDEKGRNFLDLLDDNLNIIEPTYSKGGSWLKYFGHLNSLCARATRAITNHAPISEYHLRFFPREDFACPCALYPIETRRHILHECTRYNNYWNPRRDTIAHFILFLEFNGNTFSFGESTIATCVLLASCLLFVLFFLLLVFFLSFRSFHFSCHFYLNVCSYLVVTAACQRAPCNKLLI